MASYIPAIVWLISAAICVYIARKRHVKLSFLWMLVVVFLGPLALPLMFFAKPEK